MFSRVNPGGFGFGGEVSSPQFNQLDIDHANALDKTAAGDTLSGFININPLTGGWAAGVSGAVGVSVGNSITMSWNPSTGTPFIGIGVSSGIILAQNSSIVSEVANGILATAAGGITTTVGGGISDGVVSGIHINNAGGLVTQTPGGILLSGGPTDYVQYATGRTRSISQSFAQTLGGLPANWILVGTGLGNNNDSGTGFSVPIQVHHGATLSTVTMFLAVGASHASVPTMPTFDVQRVPLAAGVGSNAATQHLNSGGAISFSPAPGTGAAWYASGHVQSTVYTANQNSVIDATNYEYLLVVVDETGGSMHFSNTYLGFTSLFTGISSNAPG